MNNTTETPQNTKPKKLPPYAVIIEDDDKHTFAYVIDLIQKVFGYTMQKATKLAFIVDADGEALVWSGPKEVAELKYEQIKSGGPDIYTLAKVEFALKCRIEPLR